MKTVILLIFIVSYTLASFNCSSSWNKYKSVKAGSFRYSSEIETEFTFNRTIRYRCSNDSIIQFKTNWTTKKEIHQNVQNFKLISVGIQNSCQGENCKNIRLNVSVQFRTRFWISNWRYIGWSAWSLPINGNHFFVVKNCDKLYWTNWIETTSCASSSHVTLRRSCADCDGDALEQKYCDATGLSVLKKNCSHYWGDWTEGTCVTTGCNTVGERVSTRQCLHADGREAIDVILCSNGNESANIKEECTNNTISDECLPPFSSGTDNAENTSFYVGIGVAVSFIVFFCILLVIVRYCHHKSLHFPSNATANTKQTSPYEFANATVKTDEQSDDVPRPVEVSQQNPAEAYQFANPTNTSKDRSFRDLKSAEQNKQKDELAEKSLAYDIAQIDGSNAYQVEQVSDQAVCVMETPDVLNTYEIAMRADLNVYEIEDLSQYADSNLPTTQSIEGSLEQSNTYSSLQSSRGVEESIYSKLEH